VVAAAVKARGAAGVMGQQIVMERGSPAAPDAAIPVRPLGMVRKVQAFADQTPLQGKIRIVIE